MTTSVASPRRGARGPQTVRAGLRNPDGGEVSDSELLLVARGRIIAAERKAESGKPPSEQAQWLSALALDEAESHVWRPGDLSHFRLQGHSVANAKVSRWAL